MEPEIVRKLVAELGQPITSEPQAVYILVELRKLLEENETLDRYRTLKLCCDWAVHPKLSLASAQVITKLFDDYEAKYRREAVGVVQVEMPELIEFCEHTRFRGQLVEACEANGIPADAPRDDEWWRSFLTQYSEVVRDCPIEARADNTKYVVRVTASAIAPESIGIIESAIRNLLDVGAQGHQGAGHSGIAILTPWVTVARQIAGLRLLRIPFTAI